MDQNKGNQPEDQNKDQDSDTPVYHDLDINQGEKGEKSEEDRPTSDQG